MSLLPLTACAADTADFDGPYAHHEEARDYEEDLTTDEAAASLMPGTFQQNYLMADSHFEGRMSAAAVQIFLHGTPYGKQSWLASERINGRTAAAAFADAGRTYSVNPILLLARVQVERSAISNAKRPTRQHDIDYLMGCGCTDSGPCDTAYKGLDKQLACTARTLRNSYSRSVAGSSNWRKGNPKRSMDRITVTPQNHATAALYAYTPWVGNGGNKLVWNITRKFTGARAAPGPVSPATA